MTTTGVMQMLVTAQTAMLLAAISWTLASAMTALVQRSSIKGMALMLGMLV